MVKLELYMPLHGPIFVSDFIHKEVRLPIDEAHMIMPAYAITVHKSQGSEYGVVIIPFVPRYGGMLQRNLLYTAVTRAKAEGYYRWYNERYRTCCTYCKR